jgi:hypothetical protein
MSSIISPIALCASACGRCPSKLEIFCHWALIGKGEGTVRVKLRERSPFGQKHFERRLAAGGLVERDDPGPTTTRIRGISDNEITTARAQARGNPYYAGG